jgi:hypothetical protein
MVQRERTGWERIADGFHYAWEAICYFFQSWWNWFGTFLIIIIGLSILALVIYLLVIGEGALSGWMIAFVTFIGLAAFTKFVINPKKKSDIVSAFSTLCTNIAIFIILGGICYRGFYPPLPFWMPYAAFWLLIALFILSIGVFITYFLNWMSMGNAYRYFRFNFLKGFGGETFSEFANSMGLLVSVGIYQTLDPSSGTYWWAAQIAALIAAMSAASWVQRYVLEKPNFPEGVSKGPNEWDYLKMASSNILGSIGAMLVVLSILIPTADNVSGMRAATASLNEGVSWPIFAAWGLVMLLWLISAQVPLLKLSSSKNWLRNFSSDDFLNSDWLSREKVGLFLIITRAGTVITTLMILFSGVWMYSIWVPSPAEVINTWPNWVSLIFGFFAALLLLLGMILKWYYDSYRAEDRELKLFLIFKDIAVFAGGIVILLGLIIPPSGWWASLYMLILGINAYAFLMGILAGAYKWSSKPKFLIYPASFREWFLSWFSKPVEEPRGSRPSSHSF